LHNAQVDGRFHAFVTKDATLSAGSPLMMAAAMRFALFEKSGC
jgi:hypothetical protein